MAVDCSQRQTRVSRALSSGIDPVLGRNQAPPYAGEPDIDSWARRMVIGDPDTCIERLQSLADAGITYLQTQFEFGGMDHDVSLRSFELFCREVMPAVAEIVPRQVDGDERAAKSKAYAEAGTYYMGA